MKRIAALILCLCLLLPVFSGFGEARAADSYLITIAENTVLDRTGDSEMAVYIDGIIYIPYHTIQNMSSVYVNYNQEHQLVTVYRVGAVMKFELDTGRTYDAIQQWDIAVSAKMRSGVPYLPVSILSAWLGMYFSFISDAQSGVGYPMIRLASDTPALSDASVLARNHRKIEQVAAERDRLSGGKTPTVVPERDLALLFSGLPEGQEAGLSELLTTLDGFSLPAAFFFHADELRACASSVREIYARGYTPGILVDPESEDVLADARKAASLYAKVLHVRVRPVSSQTPLSEEQRAALTEAGFLVWQPENPLPEPGLTGRKLEARVKKYLRSAPERSSLQLPCSEALQKSLPLLCSYLVGQNFAVSALDEWVEPF